MGRYTSVQTYADNNERQVPVPYEKATGGAKAEPGAPTRGKNATTVRTTEVRETSGSTAGAGSLNFHVYRIERRREMERLQQMDTDHDRLIADQNFHAQLERNRREAETRTAVRAEKRKRRKERARSQRKRPHGDASKDDDDDDEREDDEEDDDGGGAVGESGAVGDVAAVISKKVSAPLVADDAVEALLANDGRFLERYNALISHGAAATTVASSGGTSVPTHNDDNATAAGDSGNAAVRDRNDVDCAAAVP